MPGGAQDGPKGFPNSLVGRQLGGRYRLVDLIGTGGMGAVFRAHDETSDRRVAVKVLSPFLREVPNLRVRFLREARVTGRIEHPNVLDAEDAGETEEGLLYQVMELLVGETLQARMARGGLPPAGLLEIVAQACDGLAAAHALGVVHRDVSPANVFLVGPVATQTPQVKLLDFGIAFVLAEARLTRPGEVLGNPRYIPPEAVLGRDAVPASDLYSVGVVLYEALAGKPPLHHTRATNLAMMHVTTEPAPLRMVAPQVDEALADLVMGCLAKQPEDRPSSAADVARTLRATKERLA
jgi:serine/threonine protein kinase